MPGNADIPGWAFRRCQWGSVSSSRRGRGTTGGHWAIGHSESQETRTVTVSPAQLIRRERVEIQPAPAFSADDLMDEPRENWITNGGTLWSQRYSPLDEIGTANVDQLKGFWMIDLRGSGTAASGDWESDHPCSITRKSSSRECGQVLALP